MSGPRRRPMRRIGDLIPDAARSLGLEDELRLARAIATFEALVAERVPAAAGACRVVRMEGFTIDVEADAPIVAQELRLRAAELAAAFASAPGGVGVRRLRVHVRREGPRV
ncbi:MAG: DciA family protein [Candidatus Limnocylindrales bacterium]